MESVHKQYAYNQFESLVEEHVILHFLKNYFIFLIKAFWEFYHIVKL